MDTIIKKNKEGYYISAALYIDDINNINCDKIEKDRLELLTNQRL